MSETRRVRRYSRHINTILQKNTLVPIESNCEVVLKGLEPLINGHAHKMMSGEVNTKF